jgi:hypothetical protein
MQEIAAYCFSETPSNFQGWCAYLSCRFVLLFQSQLMTYFCQHRLENVCAISAKNPKTQVWNLFRKINIASRSAVSSCINWQLLHRRGHKWIPLQEQCHILHSPTARGLQSNNHDCLQSHVWHQFFLYLLYALYKYEQMITTCKLSPRSWQTPVSTANTQYLINSLCRQPCFLYIYMHQNIVSKIDLFWLLTSWKVCCSITEALEQIILYSEVCQSSPHVFFYALYSDD